MNGRGDIMPRVNGFNIGKTGVEKNNWIRKFLKLRQSDKYLKKYIDFVFDYRNGNVICPFTKRHIIGKFDSFQGVGVWYVREHWYPKYDEFTGEYLGFYEGSKWYDACDARSLNMYHGIFYENGM